MVSMEGKNFGNLGFQIGGKYISDILTAEA